MHSKYYLSLILSVLVFCTVQAPSFATITSAADSVIVIDPFPGFDPGNGGPKAPVFVPISASYDSVTSSVILFFTNNLGEIEVEVLNSTTGGRFTSIVDTQFLYAIIPVNLGPGHYIITFTLPSGQQFQGDFYV